MTPHAARRIVEEFDKVLELAQSSRAKVDVTVQRRAHPGYKFLYDYLSEFVEQWGVPISFIDIYHADGMWCMPGEYSTRNYHPYKHGYGKLMHSGYHFLDLLMWLNSINETKLPLHKVANWFEVHCRQFGAEDLYHQTNDTDLHRLTGAEVARVCQSREQAPADLSALGEANAHALLQFIRADEGGVDSKVVCTAVLNLMQNSFSRRGWFEPDKDLYKGNGRVRHERLVVHVGPLLSIHVHSYQSHEVKKPDPPQPAGGSELTRSLLERCGLNPNLALVHSADYGPGHQEHFDVTIYRNVEAVGGVPLEHVPIGSMINNSFQTHHTTYIGHNEHSRKKILDDWLTARVDSVSPLVGQRPTMHLLSCMYETLALNRQYRRGKSDHDSKNSASGAEMPITKPAMYKIHRCRSDVTRNDHSPSTGTTDAV